LPSYSILQTWAERMEEEENAYKNFVGKTKEKGPHGKRRYRR